MTAKQPTVKKYIVNLSTDERERKRLLMTAYRTDPA